jgi:hypothetical protein
VIVVHGRGGFGGMRSDACHLANQVTGPFGCGIRRFCGYEIQCSVSARPRLFPDRLVRSDCAFPGGAAARPGASLGGRGARFSCRAPYRVIDPQELRVYRSIRGDARL